MANTTPSEHARKGMLCVHAHPDDETIFTGGMLALEAEHGLETVVVTCTDGRYGFAPGGVPFGASDHDPVATASMRSSELLRAASLLSVARVVQLGYADSGMRGWKINQAREAFVQADTNAVARTIAALIDEHRPSRVVTYDRFGLYGHPDHIKAHEVTVRALGLCEHHAPLQLVTIARSALPTMAAVAARDAVELPAWFIDVGEFGVDDDAIDDAVDVSSVVAQKRRALAAHASQLDNNFFLELPEAVFGKLFSVEYLTS